MPVTADAWPSEGLGLPMCPTDRTIPVPAPRMSGQGVQLTLDRPGRALSSLITRPRRPPSQFINRCLGADQLLSGKRAGLPLPAPPELGGPGSWGAAGSGIAEPSWWHARFLTAPFSSDTAAPRAPRPRPPRPRPRRRRPGAPGSLGCRRYSRGEARAARDLGPLLRSREAAASADAPDAAAAASATTPPSVLLPRGHGPTAPQGSPFPQDGRPSLHAVLGGRAAPPAAGPPPAHRCQRGPLHVHGAAGGGAPRPAAARGGAGRAGPAQGLQLPRVCTCLRQPPAAAEPPRVALGPQALHVRRLRQSLQALQPPVAAPRHAPRPGRPAAHLPSVPAPLPGRRRAGAARAPALNPGPSGPRGPHGGPPTRPRLPAATALPGVCVSPSAPGTDTIPSLPTRLAA